MIAMFTHRSVHIEDAKVQLPRPARATQCQKQSWANRCGIGARNSRGSAFIDGKFHACPMPTLSDRCCQAHVPGLLRRPQLRNVPRSGASAAQCLVGAWFDRLIVCAKAQFTCIRACNSDALMTIPNSTAVPTQGFRGHKSEQKWLCLQADRHNAMSVQHMRTSWTSPSTSRNIL